MTSMEDNTATRADERAGVLGRYTIYISYSWPAFTFIKPDEENDGDDTDDDDTNVI